MAGVMEKHLQAQTNTQSLPIQKLKDEKIAKPNKRCKHQQPKEEKNCLLSDNVHEHHNFPHRKGEGGGDGVSEGEKGCSF